MTRYLLDVAIWQGDLKPADVKRAGFNGVNLKISHGTSRKNVHPKLTWWIDQARALGLDICTFHYMTADAVGDVQAEYAYDLLRSLGLLYGTAHQLDVESDPAPALASVRAYLERMTLLLERPVALYTGDWWWAARGKWNVSDLSPYLWAAPNDGYPGSYPGDTSSKWTAGYGGWPALSVMQYAVQPLSFPDGSRGTIDVSKSAIRSEDVWRDLTLGRSGVTTVPPELAKARRIFLDKIPNMDPLSMGIKGDGDHTKTGSSYHLGEDELRPDSYSIVESSRDRNGLDNDASAMDIGEFSIKGADGKTHTLRTFSVWLVGECERGAADTRDIREVIYSPDGKVVKRWDQLKIRSTGPSSHLIHTHVSKFRDASGATFVALFTRYFAEIEDDMALSDDDKKWLQGEIAKAAKPVWTFDPGNDTTGELNGGVPKPGWTKAGDNATVNPAWALSRAIVGTDVAYQIRDRVDQANTTLAKILTNVLGDDAEAQQVIAEVKAAQAKTVEDVLAGLGGSGRTDEQVAAALTAALGSRAAAVAALMG